MAECLKKVYTPRLFRCAGVPIFVKKNMDKYGLVGYPLKHSFSQRFFTGKFDKEKIDAEYLNFEIEEIGLFPDIIRANPSLRGLNVTIPYKEQVIRYLDELDEEAGDIGAVNVIKIIREGDTVKLKGYNSDIIGFRNSIAPLIDAAKHHRKALVLGTGGASKAVVKGLLGLGLETRYVSRSARIGAFVYKDLFDNKEILKEYTVIINSSPVGTFPNVDHAPEIPYSQLTDRHLLYDLVYNPAETKFLRLGREHGATIKNGEEMLHLQAIAAWAIWNRP